MKLTYAIQIYKSMFPMKNDLNSLHILYAGLHKSFPMHYGQCWESFKNILLHLYCIKYNEICSFSC